MSLDFVGRTIEIKQYLKFLTQEIPWVLVVRGLGGSGKSVLLAELARQTPQDSCVVTIDFEQDSLREHYLTLLEHFSDQVKYYCDPERTVDLQNSIAEGRREIGKRVATGNTWIDEINQKVLVGDYANAERIRSAIEIGETQIQQTRREMGEIAKAKFYAQMKTFAKKRLVIMIDTGEWLNETQNVEAGRWAMDEIIPWLHSHLTSKGQQCFVVITSRVPLKLHVIKQHPLREMKLGLLSKAEMEQCLIQMDITDPSIIDEIYRITFGYPYGLSIVHKIWEEQWEMSDKPLSVADLPELRKQFYELVTQGIIISGDVLTRLLKSPLDELSRYGVLLRQFNFSFMQAVFPEYLPPESETVARNRFEQLVIYPHVEPRGDAFYVFNKVLRSILAKYIRATEPKKWKHYHRLALDFLEEAAESMRSPEWYYHQLAFDEEKGISYWKDIQNQAPPQYLDDLREVARDETLNLTPATLAYMATNAMGRTAC